MTDIAGTVLIPGGHRIGDTSCKAVHPMRFPVHISISRDCLDTHAVQEIAEMDFRLEFVHEGAFWDRHCLTEDCRPYLPFHSAGQYGAPQCNR